jgi:hypothetical protein
MTASRLAFAAAALLFAAPAFAQDVPIPEKIPSPPSEELEPTVRIHTGDNVDVITEYRDAGQVYMIRVKPKNGPEYTIVDTNGDGKLDKRDAEESGGVVPVHYTIAEWD